MQLPADFRNAGSQNAYVDACETCRGIWLDSGELERIQDARERDYSARLQDITTIADAYEEARQERLPELSCPSCGASMVPREYGYCSQILIDACPECRGIWLDRGELEALEMFFERERQRTREADEHDLPDIIETFLAGLSRMLGR